MRIADLGCGPGNITFRLAEHCPDASILGIDGAAAMLAIAEQRNQPIARAGAAALPPGHPSLHQRASSGPGPTAAAPW
jgi:trans-aconitate methyltransferase